MRISIHTSICTATLVLLVGCQGMRPESEPVGTAEPGMESLEAGEAKGALDGASETAVGAVTDTKRRPLVQPARATTAWRMGAQRLRPLSASRARIQRSTPLDDDAVVRAALERRIPSLDLEGMTRLRDAGKTLSRMTGVDVIVDPAGEAAFADAGGELTLALEHPVRLRNALNLLTDDAGEDVAWTVRHGAVFITSKERARGRPKTIVLDVNDLLWGPTNFAAPEMDLLPSGALFELPEPDEAQPFLQDEALIDMIRATIAPGTWDEPGNSIEIVNGKLYITHD